MKLFKSLFASLAILALATACKSDEQKTTWEDYAEWRDANESWIAEQAAATNPDGTPMYSRIIPAWNTDAYVLMRWYNDRSKTEGNLQPIYTSTVDVKYYGQRFDKVPFDSSYLSISPADSLYRTKVKDVIPGWTIALEQMHVGDSVEVIIPWQQAYGSSSQGKLILPYSALRFQIKLADVAGEFIRP